MGKKSPNFKETGIHVSLFGVLVLRDGRLMKVTDLDFIKEVNTTIFSNIKIKRDSNRNLYLELEEHHHPLTFVFDEEYNCKVDIDGISYLFVLENPWERVDLESNEIIPENNIEKLAIRDLKTLSGEYELHLDIIPEPYWGDIVNANVFILSGNPGYGEIEDGFRKNGELIAKIQDNLNQTSPTNLTSPNLLWIEEPVKIKNGNTPHPGYGFWKKMMGAILEKEKEPNICVIEFFPYHSQKIAGEMKTCAMTLPSSDYINYFIEKAIHDKKWIVIARCKSEWLNRINGLKHYKNTTNKVLVTKGQTMKLTENNLQKEVDLGADSPAGAPTWQEFLKACQKNNQ